MQLSSSRNAIGCEREVELSRLSINNEPLIFNDNIGAAPAESNGSRESARRQKLISLYSDILDLLKQNRTKAPPVPIQQSKQTKTILVPVPADSKRKPRANKDSRRQHETSKSRSKSPDDVMSTDTLPMAPSAAPLSETKEAAATPLAHEKTSITAGGVEYNNKLPSNPSVGKEEGLAASEAENLDTVVAPSTFENQDEAFSDNLLSSAPQSDAEDSHTLSDIGERNHELDISDDVMEEQPSIRNESLQSSDTIPLSEPEVPPSDSTPLSPDSISSVLEQNIAIRISSSINDVSPSRVSDSDFSDRSCQDVTSLHENESTVSSHSPPDAELDDNKLAPDAMSWSDSISSETSLTPDDKEAFSPIVSHEDDAPVAQPVTSVATNVDESETDMIVNDDVEPPLSLGTNVVSVEHSIHSTSRSSTQDNVEEARHISKPPSAISDTESISGYSETPSLEYENSTVVLPGASIQPLTEQKRQILDALMLLLESVPILKDLPKERLRSLLPYFKLQSYPPRAAIILAGEKPRYFYILASGTVSAYSYEGVNKPNRLLRKYLNTDYFGELSLINKQACTSYIIAESHVTVQTMSGSNFLKLLKDLLPKFRERALASYSSNKNDDTNAEVTTVKKDFPDVSQFISGIPIVNVLAKQQNVAKLFRYRELSDGEILVKSILELRDLCVVYKGALDVKLHGSKKIAVIDPKSFIGGVDCFDSQVVDAMASSHLVASGDTLLLILDGDILRERCKNVLEHVRHFLEQYFRDKLQELELLQGVDSLSARFERITHSVNATISLTQQSSIAGSFINDSSEGELDSEDGSPVSVSTDTPYVSALTGSKMSFVETPNDSIETKSMEDDSDIMSSSKEASIQSNDRSDAPAAASISVASSIQQNDLDSDTMVTTETSDLDDSDSFTSNTI
ncbi:Cyclic nucleotide-binding domain family protein [Babesia bovis T2Bo]|uniref:Cyclic nucleotide-binding domain family protein n=1 Tax=Babesia bovis T2Bo TaxID=484906 RepID=UPI001C3661AC|nr:Cyclic nucleotide-binding domain family protein [Babesia bovis T2Bo]KAG6440151.1 Cyclic nucleotide-binding domain family protein [Babesia bovis T2Bo]